MFKDEGVLATLNLNVAKNLCSEDASAQLEVYFHIYLHRHWFAVFGCGREFPLLYGVHRVLFKSPVRGADHLDVIHATLVVDRHRHHDVSA